MTPLDEAVSRHLARFDARTDVEVRDNAIAVEACLRCLWGDAFDARLEAVSGLPGEFGLIVDLLEYDGHILHDLDVLQRLDAIAQAAGAGA